MTDQELDRLMRHVLMDGVEQKSEQPSEADNGEAPAFQPSPRYQRQITAMKRDPWAWAKKKQRPAWKKWTQTAAALLLVAGLGLADVRRDPLLVNGSQALWDIAGKAYDAPVHALLGGAVRTAARSISRNLGARRSIGQVT